MPASDPFDSTLELLRRAQAGDSVALESLLERFRDPLLERIRLMMGGQARCSAESLDFLQGMFLEVIQGLEGVHVRDEQSLLRWMTTIARNNIRDHVRRTRERALESLTASCLCRSDLENDVPSPPSEAAVQEDVHTLIEALLELAPDHRRVIELRDLDELRFREIAELMDRSEDAVHVLHTRALVRLGRLLNEP